MVYLSAAISRLEHSNVLLMYVLVSVFPFHSTAVALRHVCVFVWYGCSTYAFKYVSHCTDHSSLITAVVLGISGVLEYNECFCWPID